MVDFAVMPVDSVLFVELDFAPGRPVTTMTFTRGRSRSLWHSYQTWTPDRLADEIAREIIVIAPQVVVFEGAGYKYVLVDAIRYALHERYGRADISIERFELLDGPPSRYLARSLVP